MSKRTKTRKLFKSNLKLEALEQRQLLAGVTGSGTELVNASNNPNAFFTSGGNKYDQVLLTGSSVTVTNDVDPVSGLAANITRVSFLDLQGDIVQAEFSGKGSLSISMADGYTTGNAPSGYNQSGVLYVKGLATFSISGSDETTNINIFSVGSGNAVNSALFDSTHKGGDNTADIARISILANPSAPNGSAFGGIFAGNAKFSADSGVVGITAANVQVQNIVRIGDIDATGSATPTLTFGTQSQFGDVLVTGGDLIQTNGKSINNTSSYGYTLTLAAGTTSGGATLPAATTGSQLSFTGANPVAAAIKISTLTSGIDTITGSSGADTINGVIGTATGVSQTLTSLDSIDGGLGANTLAINDVQGGQALPGGVTLKNIQTLTLASVGVVGAAGVGNSFDTSGLTGLTAVNIVQSKGADFITGGAGQAVTVFDTAGVVTLTGGSTQTVTTAGGLVLSGAAGAITAVDTAQAKIASTIDGGTTVDLKSTSASSPTALVDTVTFVPMTLVGQTVTILGTTFTSATGAESAATVAAAFASGTNLTSGAGVFWNSGAVVGNTVTFTATAAGVNDVKLVPSGSAAVLPTVSEVASTGAITIGNTTKPTGAITVSDTLNGGYAGNLTAGAITVKGGTTVSVTEAPVTAVNPTEQGSNFTVTQGSVAVTGGSTTTSVTIVQAPSASSATTAAAIANLAEVETVTFPALVAGQRLTVAGLTYVAPAGGASSDKVAAAFANLANTALSNWSSGAVTNTNQVTFTGGNSSTTVPYTGSVLVDTVTFAAVTANQTVTILGVTFNDATDGTGTGSTAAAVAAKFASQTLVSGGQSWTTGAVAGNNVVFTASAGAAGINDVKIVPTGTATAPVVAQVDNSLTLAEVVQGHGSSGSSGRTGVSGNTVTITDPNQNTGTNTITTVALTNYTGTSTIASDALTNLTLTNTNASNNGGAALGTLNITNVTATTLDLTVTGGNNGNVGTVGNNTYQTLKVHTTGSNASLTFNDTQLTTLTVDGSRTLSLTAGGLTKLATVAVSGTAGFSSSSLAATVTDINASATSGNVSVTLPAAGTTYEGGSGNDNVTIGANPTAAISGGAAGTDTLTLATTLVANPSANTFISGFETLATATGATTGTFDATGFTAVSNGQANVTFTNVAAGTPLSSSGGSTTYTLKTATGAEALTINASNTSTVTVPAVNGFYIPTVTVAGSTGGNSTLTLVDTGATSITVTNGGSTRAVTLTTTGNTLLTSVDASAMGGGAFTYVAAGTTAETVKGGAGGDNLTASATAPDILIGGAGNDTLISGGYGQTTLTGGSGADTFVVATVGTSLNTYTKITDASVGDVLRLANLGQEVFNATKINNLADTADFQSFANEVVIKAGDASTNGAVGWFQFAGNTYVVESLHNNATTIGFKDGTDLIVRMEGLIDLSNSTMLQTSGGSPEIIIR